MHLWLSLNLFFILFILFILDSVVRTLSECRENLPKWGSCQRRLCWKSFRIMGGFSNNTETQRWLPGKSELETQRQATQHDCLSRWWAMGRWGLIKCAERNIIFCTEPEIKIKKCGKESTLFNRLRKHSFGGLGADIYTDFLRVDFFFCGKVGCCRLFQRLNWGSPFSL